MKELLSYACKYDKHFIQVFEDIQANQNCRYWAKCDGDSAWGDSPEHAIHILKSRIDLSVQFANLEPLPLTDYEKTRLVNYVKGNDYAISRQLKKKHYISTFGDPCFSNKEILHGYSIIQDTLQAFDRKANITCFSFENSGHTYYALIDCDYYYGLKYDWQNELADKILMQE